MTNKDIKRYSTSCIISELQIRITIKYHYTPIRMAKSKTLTTSNANKLVEQ